MGWSVRTTRLDQTICNEEGQKFGAVDDLIIQKNLRLAETNLNEMTQAATMR